MVFILTVLFTMSLWSINTSEQELKLTRKLMYETARVMVFNNSRAVLDEIYKLPWYEDISYTNSEYITNFRDDINQYKSIDVKRKRMEYMYNQNRNISIASLVPDSLSVTNVILAATNPKMLIIALAETTLSSIGSYLTNKQREELDYIQSGWDLDDEASRVFNHLNNYLFQNLTTLSHNLGFTRDDYASIQTLQDFVKLVEDAETSPDLIIEMCVGTNYERELSKFPDYWRVIGTAYYEIGDYNNSLEAINNFEKYYEKVFYNDPQYANMMMIKAFCIDELSLNKLDVVDELLNIAKIICDNINVGDGLAQKYYCYLIYKDIAEYTGDTKYLEKAYSVLKEIFRYALMEYENNLKYYFSYQLDSDIKSALKNMQEQIDIKLEDKYLSKSQISNLQTERNKIVNKLDNKKSEYVETKISKRSLPPSEYLIISLGYEFNELSAKLNKTESHDYKSIMRDLNKVIQDNYTRIIFFGDTILNTEIDIRYEDHYKFLGMGDSVDVMTFQVPISNFTFITDDLSDMKIEICNISEGIDVIIPYSENKNERGWNYEIVRTAKGDAAANMSNIFIKFKVLFPEPPVTIKKGNKIPTLFFKFNGINNQLERLYNMNVIDQNAFNTGFFKIVN